MGAPYSGRNLYAKFGDTVLSGRYKTFSESDEVAVIDQSCVDNLGRTWLVGTNEGGVSLELLQEAGGTALWAAVAVGSEGTLSWSPEGLTAGANYTIDAIVKARKRNVIHDDIVKIVLDFLYRTSETSESSNRAGEVAILLSGFTLSAAGTVTGAGWRIGTASITLAGVTLSAAGTVTSGGASDTGQPIGLLLTLTKA